MSYRAKKSGPRGELSTGPTKYSEYSTREPTHILILTKRGRPARTSRADALSTGLPGERGSQSSLRLLDPRRQLTMRKAV